MRPLGELIETLRKKPYPEKLKAIEELRDGKSPECALVLITGLYDSDTRVRKAVSDALISLSEMALNPLTSALQTSDRAVRRNILLILEKITEKQPAVAKKVEEVLLNYLKDPDPVVKAQAAENLGKMKSKKAIPLIFPLLNDINFWVRSLASLVLGELGSIADEETKKKIIEALLGRLDDINPWVRRSACESLGKLKAKEAIEKISELALFDQSDIVRDAAVDALKMIGTFSLPPFQKALTSKEIKEKVQAINTLVKIGESGLTDLISLLRTEDGELKTVVSSILGQIKSPKTAEYLLQVLKTEKGDIPILLINALSEMREEKVVRYLISLLSHPDPLLADETKRSLEKMGEYALPFLLEELNNQDPKVRMKVCEILGNIGKEDALSPLTKKMADENPWVRAAACESLGKIGKKEVVPHLIIALKDHSPLVRAKACEALRLIRSPYGIGELTARVKDDDLLVKISALKALIEIKGEEAKPIAISALQDEDVEMRVEAINALGQLEAIETLPILEKISKPWPFSREDDTVKEAARRVIKKFKEIIAYRREKMR